VGIVLHACCSILPNTAGQPVGAQPFDTSHCLSAWLLQLLASTHLRPHHRSAQPCEHHVHFALLKVLARQCWQVVMQMCLCSQIHWASQQPGGTKSCVSRQTCMVRAKRLCLHITMCNLIHSVAPIAQCCLALCWSHPKRSILESSSKFVDHTDTVSYGFNCFSSLCHHHSSCRSLHLYSLCIFPYTPN